jgi:hypothetical protein
MAVQGSGLVRLGGDLPIDGHGRYVDGMLEPRAGGSLEHVLGPIHIYRANAGPIRTAVYDGSAVDQPPAPLHMCRETVGIVTDVTLGHAAAEFPEQSGVRRRSLKGDHFVPGLEQPHGDM